MRYPLLEMWKQGTLSSPLTLWTTSETEASTEGSTEEQSSPRFAVHRCTVVVDFRMDQSLHL
jgi:hypothetical protein